MYLYRTLDNFQQSQVPFSKIKVVSLAG
jgi:hypothetical protein